MLVNCKKEPKRISRISQRLREDIDFLTECIKENGYAYTQISQEIREKHRELAMIALETK